MLDKKRDFFQNWVFYRRNFLELQPERFEEMAGPAGLIPAHVSTQNPLPPQQETEALLRQRL
jgi:hypothetical protein